MHAAALYSLVDRLYELAMLGLCGRVVAARHCPLEAVEVRLDLRRVTAVFQPLTLSADNPLLLGVDVRHDSKQPRTAAARAYYSALVRDETIAAPLGRPFGSGQYA